MGGVLALAAIGAVALVGAVLAGATWRRGIDERQSVKEYHTTLETLRHVSDRVEPSRPTSAPAGRKAAGLDSAAVPGTRDAAKARAGTVAPEKVVEGLARGRASAPPEPASAPWRRGAGADTAGAASGSPGAANGSNGSHGSDGSDGSERPALVFDDASPPGAFTPDPGARRAIERMRGRPASGGSRVLTGLALAVGVVLVAGLVAGVVLAVSSSHTTNAAHGSTHSTSSTPRVSSHAAPSTAPVTVQPASSTAATATYTSPSGSYTVVLSTSGLCWILATDLDTGRVLWTGTMDAGQSQTLTGTGPMRVEIGAASVIAMTLQGSPVVLPSPFQSPFTATFTPAA